MKPRNYFGAALLFPYILWCVCASILFLLSSLDESEALNFVLMPIAFYVLGVILWFLPYTVIAIGLWLWSRNKPTKFLWRAATLAPFFLFILTAIEAMIISLPADSATEFLEEAISQMVFLGVFSLLFGYLCVGIAAGVYKILQSRKLVVDEIMAPQS